MFVCKKKAQKILDRFKKIFFAYFSGSNMSGHFLTEKGLMRVTSRGTEQNRQWIFLHLANLLELFE